MKHLSKSWGRLWPQLALKHLLLFLDYDGTLTPIAPTPQVAVLPKGTKLLLKKLLGLRDCQVIIISGRRLDELRKMVAVPGLTYVGNHGLEINGPSLDFRVMISGPTQRALMRIKKELESQQRVFPGLLIEDKRWTLSIHYRLVDDRKEVLLKKEVRRITAPYLKDKEIKVTFGKKVFEIRPPFLWDKGKAINWISKRSQSSDSTKAFPIVFGDDRTDEDAFAAVESRGLAVVVGAKRRSRAKYYVKDPAEVIKLLERIWRAKRGIEL
jgi:trehalose 6-phosphate phosphatase